MTNWINRDFITNLHLLTRPRLVLPDERRSGICEVHPEHLRTVGIKACLIDIHQTLTTYGEKRIAQKRKEALARLKASIPCAILSNSANHEKQIMAKIFKELDEIGIPISTSTHYKPDPRAFASGVKLLGASPDECAIIGDRIFTDIIGGNICGLHTILVEPIDARSDPFPQVAIPRKIENALLKFWTKREERKHA